MSNMLEENKSQFRILHLSKLSFKNEDKMKTYVDIGQFTLQESLGEILQFEGKWYQMGIQMIYVAKESRAS